MSDTIQQLEAQLAQVNKEIAELEAQKGIKTSQTSQPQPAQPNSVVFTNGATPQDNYLSWQYEVNQRKQNAQAQGAQNPSNNKTMTRLEWIQHKLENGMPLDLMEQWALKKAGIDPSKLSADLNVKKTEITKNHETLGNLQRAMASSHNLILKAKDQAGFWKSVDRWLHRKTKGYTDLSDGNDQYMTKDYGNTTNIAAIIKDGGRTSDESLRIAQEMYGTMASSPEMVAGKLSGALYGMLNRMNAEFLKLQSKGQKIPQNYKNYFQAYEYLYDYLDKNSRKIDYDAYGKALEYLTDYERGKVGYNFETFKGFFE